MMVSGGASASARFESDVGTPRAAREMLRDALGTWQLDGCCDAAELLVDELVSNVVRHVGSPVELRVVRRPLAVRVEVDDASTALPVLQDPLPDEGHGRGILLVESLASRWGTEVNGDGKTVWFELDVPS
jgi:anti-sigma regulatory factor (Ser/Thr protein kinase)